MKKLHLILAFLLVSVVTFGQLTITVPTVTAMPGQTVNIPVILSGAGSPGTPISSANIHVSYDTAVLTYDTLTNFYSGTPGSQWYYSGNFNSDPACNAFAVSANWLHPSLGTLAIPDGTTLYEMVFTYKGGSSPLSICIYEFTDVNFDFIPTIAVNGAGNPPSLTGPGSFCGTGSAGNVYTTDAGMSDYVWTVTGGNITGGGTTTDYTVTVTWPTAGSHNVGVTYNTNVSASLPVTVTAKVNVSVSVAASANPVTTGTSVTYTATPVNGGATPSFQWKVNGVIVGTNASTYSYVPVNGDQVFCLVTSGETCVNNPIATSNVINMVVNSLPVTPLTVTLPAKYALPGETVYFPVKLKGADVGGLPISSANIQISYDPAILEYDTLVNFYSAMPASQWFYSGNNNTVSANWIEPALLTLAIPDSTTLFEIKFTYLGGSQTLPFIVYEFTDDLFEFIPATPYHGSIALFTPVVAASTSGTIACPGGTTTVNVTATGGVPPYSGTGDFTRGAGTHSFTVTDAIGTTGVTTITLTEPPLFSLKSTMASTNGAEISAFDSASSRIYTVAGPVVEYYSLSNTGVLSGPSTVAMGFTPPAGITALPNSVAINDGIVAVSYALKNADNAQQPGRVAFYSAADGAYISDVTVGYLPDMIAFSPDGTKVLTADEGEPNSYGQPTSFDPEGSVSIIDISGGIGSASVTIAGFTSFNAQMAALKAAGVRIYGPGATVAMDLEPEYLTISGDGNTAYITLQENNAVAKLNIATATITDIYPLGLKDQSLAGNGMDASDRDVDGTSGGGGKINIQNWPVKGMYQPDAIASFTVGSDTYYVTANEGDARDYTGFTEEVRVSSATYTLDPAVFPNASTLKLSQNIGRLNVTNATGNTDGDSEFEEIHAFGARSFTIWNSSFTTVFDSQDQLEQATASRFAAGFNSDGTAATFDSRSDNKGPEPEGLALGVIDGVQYAFVGSERTGDIFVYDLTNPMAPVLKQYINTPADLGVEGVAFVAADQSPTGNALLIISAEVSKTVTVYEFSAAPVITLTGNANVQVCQNATYMDDGATAVDALGNNLTGSIVTTNPVNTAIPGTYTVTYNVTDGCGLSAAPETRSVVVNTIETVSITIVASENPVCAGTSVTFTATPVNGGENPAYQWKKNGLNVGGNSATYAYVPVNNDVITCELLSDIPCALNNPAVSNSITMTVTPKVTAGVSVAASQNPVTTGTTVTFTATPVNGGPTPDFQWKVNGVIVGTSSPTYSYIPVNGDQVFCLLTTSLTCVNNQIATSNVVTMTVTTPTALVVTLPDLTAMPGDILYFPVKLKGAGSAGVPISSANVQISYDPAVLQYDTLANFYSAMPAGQWYYSGNNNTVSANWIEPALLTLAIPDSTTLFEIKFTYLGGNSTLPFIVCEFTDATFEFIPTSHVDGSVNQLVPVNASVQDIIVVDGQDTCFNATNVITVAGNGTFFTVENGGSATFIAGQMISFLPGTTVNPGGYLHGSITLTGGYCGAMPATLVSTVTSTEETPDVAVSTSNTMVRLYPNPTLESFTIELTGDNTTVMTKAELFSIGGNKVMSVALPDVRKHQFSGAGLAPGIYFMHIYTPKGSEILKVVKL
jgi:hypothetical protein